MHALRFTPDIDDMKLRKPVELVDLDVKPATHAPYPLDIIKERLKTYPISLPTIYSELEGER